MRFFGSWWERLPRRELGTVIAIVAVLGLISFQFGGANSQGDARGYIHIQLPDGEYWD